MQQVKAYDLNQNKSKSLSSKDISKTKAQILSKGNKNRVVMNQDVSGGQILMTNKLYYVGYSYQGPGEENHLSPDLNISTPQRKLGVRRCREVQGYHVSIIPKKDNNINTKYLDDETISKSHKKEENKEKEEKKKYFAWLRRQERERRWQVSRPQPFGSLLPKLDQVTSVRVGNRVPVSAFGCPLPKIRYTDFSLGWTIGKQPDKKGGEGQAKVFRKRRRRCGLCTNCLRDNCSRCKNCKAMTKFGGNGKKHRACVYRKCERDNREYKKNENKVETETLVSESPVSKKKEDKTVHEDVEGKGNGVKAGLNLSLNN